ncbi:hypoxanthine phosphoribosyltransferase [Ascoidea rubescens DSM 1968]|uniref:Dimeric hypoxanthine-guanine phosphoribosyltransferase n=1 Tax=Ascoidea rubescens DSM 1968 TaxID=1344418 RepID=A0A1D2VLL8_9ASCO|nr:dimeric hypoxanthine-guanine phosphoribosyltransferase [Ascoidea rubescens DSM 1968]ODV62474.1 dimeric hypoxanthine-guanine phosphoribosyltransferase [Ascoidea rubescens DSM 1968]
MSGNPIAEDPEIEATKMYISYNNVHELCQKSSVLIKKFKPDLMIAIGGGGFIPARILRSFLKEPGKPNVRIMAIILSLYEDLDSVSTTAETTGLKVIRNQWIDYNNDSSSKVADNNFSLVGKRILIVDEVDDTRTTLHYALNELMKDAQKQCKERGISYESSNTEFGIFVLHDKIKPKKVQLPERLMSSGNYICAKRVPDVWIAYPWESTDIASHTERAIEQGNDI